MTVGLDRDSVVVKRPSSSGLAEGDTDDVLTTVLTTRGSWGSPNTLDRQWAAQRGQTVDAAVAMATADVRPGDVITVHGQTYDVVAVKDVIHHMRVLVRRVSS